MYSLKDLIMRFYILPDGTTVTSKEEAFAFDRR
jgi:hypothetical protein